MKLRFKIRYFPNVNKKGHINLNFDNILNFLDPKCLIPNPWAQEVN